MIRNPRYLNCRPSLRPSARLSRPHARAESSQASRVDRIAAKLPPRLRKYTNGLRNAPVSHIVSFMILHELTAIVPLVGLFGIFHYTNYVPMTYMTGHFEGYVQDGVARFEKYFKRKGWFGFDLEDKTAIDVSETVDVKAKEDAAIERWQSGDGRYKVVIEIALAYAITKALLPIRIIGSVWATPWFAGVLMRAKGIFKRTP